MYVRNTYVSIVHRTKSFNHKRQRKYCASNSAKLTSVGDRYSMIFLYLSAGTLSSETTYRSSSCAGTSFQPACTESNEVIAVERIQHGTKLTTTCGSSNRSDGCCSYNNIDCLLPPYTGTTVQTDCSGKQLCTGTTPAAADTSSCGPDQYPRLSHYLTMEYYCLPGKYI